MSLDLTQNAAQAQVNTLRSAATSAAAIVADQRDTLQRTIAGVATFTRTSFRQPKVLKKRPIWAIFFWIQSIRMQQRADTGML